MTKPPFDEPGVVVVMAPTPGRTDDRSGGSNFRSPDARGDPPAAERRTGPWTPADSGWGSVLPLPVGSNGNQP